MHIAHALLTAFFLVLVAISAAVVVSMVALALFDLCFGKKPSPARDEKDAIPPEQSKSTAIRSRAKPKPSLALARHRRPEPQLDCGPESQKVRHIW